MAMADAPLLRVCNVTFMVEGDSPDGKSLLRCSRCQGCFYQSKEEQKAHWKVHKKVCRRASAADEDIISDLAMAEASEQLSFSLANRSYGPELGLLLRRMDVLFRSGHRDVSPHLKQMLHVLFTDSSDRALDLIWSSPGVASYILSVDLLSDQMRELKQKEMDASDIEARATDGKYDASRHLVPEYGEIIVRILFASAMYPKSPTRALRETGFGRAALKKAMELWTDPFVRASLSFEDGTRGQLFPLMAMTGIDKSPFDSEAPEYIAPGLTLENAILTLVSDRIILMKENRFHEIAESIDETSLFEPQSWDALGVEGRARCALALVGALPRADDIRASGMPSCQARGLMGLVVRLLGPLTGHYRKDGPIYPDGKHDASLRLAVWSAASRDKTVDGLRRGLKMRPPDYFAISLEKNIEMTLPLAEAFEEECTARHWDHASLPQEVLKVISEYASDPFSEDVCGGLELQYLCSIW